MRLFRFLYLSFLCIIFYSCQRERENPNSQLSLEDLKAWNTTEYTLYSHKIRQTISNLYQRSGHMYADAFTRQYYANQSPFLWISRTGIDKRADSLLTYLEKASVLGLSPQFFQTASIQEDLKRVRQLRFDSSNDINTVFGRLEYHLTQAYLRYACGQRYGFVKPSQLFNTLELNNPHKPSSYTHLYDIPTETANEAFVKEALSILKKGDFATFFQQITPTENAYTLLQKALAEQTEKNVREKIAVNMERCRWRTPRPQKKYVWVNLAAMTLYAVDEEKETSLAMKVCGGNLKHKTPLLTSEIQRVDMNPYWNIPYSIIKKEIAPLHAQDIAYFTRNRIRIFDKSTGEEIDPSLATADLLKSGTCHLRQDNGEGNSLGRLIFRFPNNFSVYLHDTNNKGAFLRNNRAISHGCIRLEKPLELAIFLMENPQEKEIDEIRMAIDLPPLKAKGTPVERKEENLKSKTHRFNPPIPVYLVYYTLYPNPRGELEHAQDVYGYDKIILKKISAP